MTVSNPTVVDFVARSESGRYLLVMVEGRFYSGGDHEVMVEQLREKLNAYIHLIRSGQLEEMIGPDVRQRGVDIELSCRDHPPLAVREMLQVVQRGLAEDGVGVDHRMVPPPTPEQVYDLLASLLTAEAPPDWQRIDLSATLVGDGLAGGLYSTGADGEKTRMPPAPELIQAIQDLKRALWEPQHGTFVTMEVSIVGTSLQPSFDWAEPPDGADGYTREDWAEELRRYPRVVLPAWWRARIG